MSKSRKKLDLSTLCDRLEAVQILEMNKSTKDKTAIVVFRCKAKSGTEFDVGLFGDESIKIVVDQHAYSEAGKNMIEIPSSKVRESGVSWISDDDY